MNKVKIDTKKEEKKDKMKEMKKGPNEHKKEIQTTA